MKMSWHPSHDPEVIARSGGRIGQCRRCCVYEGDPGWEDRCHMNKVSDAVAGTNRLVHESHDVVGSVCRRNCIDLSAECLISNRSLWHPSHILTAYGPNNALFCATCICHTGPCAYNACLGPPVHEATRARPAYYGGKDNPYEAIKVINAWGLNFSLGNCVKYVCRAGKKDSATRIEDLEKARTYLGFEIERLKDESKT
jgi:hypothetical protein